MPPPEQRQPFPDEAHEYLAIWVEENLAEIRTSRADVGDSFLLVDVLFDLLDQALSDIAALQAQVAALLSPPP